MSKLYCIDCKSKVFASKYFMVTNDLWEKYGDGKNHLCINCFEKRIGRQLNRTDLLKCFVNENVNSITMSLLSENQKLKL